MIALADCNSFYASCERIFRPDLSHRPIVVLSNNDGCVVAMDRQAKSCGIRRGTPLFQAAADLAAINAAVFSSNYTLYQDISDRVMEVLLHHARGMEVYSIDEAFLFLDNSAISLLTLGHAIKNDVARCTGIPVSIGFARTKTLAKVANRWAKASPESAGIYILEKEQETEILSKTNIMDIWGIGPRKAAFLFTHRIRTARELRDTPDHWIKKHLTFTTLRTVWELRGIHAVERDQPDEPKKMILSSLGFSKPVRDLQSLETAVSTYAATAVRKLAAQKSEASGVLVFIKTHRHKQPYYSGAREMRLSRPSAYLPDISRAAISGLHAAYHPGLDYVKAGVCLLGIDPPERYQYEFHEGNHGKKRVLADAVRDLQDRFGPNVISSGTANRIGDWAMKRQSLSPHYTTRWQDLPPAT